MAIVAYAACISACNAVAASCYLAGGLNIGTITLGIGAPPVAIACSAAQGVCMVACSAGAAATGCCCVLM